MSGMVIIILNRPEDTSKKQKDLETHQTTTEDLTTMGQKSVTLPGFSVVFHNFLILETFLQVFLVSVEASAWVAT